MNIPWWWWAIGAAGIAVAATVVTNSKNQNGGILTGVSPIDWNNLTPSQQQKLVSMNLSPTQAGGQAYITAAMNCFQGTPCHQHYWGNVPSTLTLPTPQQIQTAENFVKTAAPIAAAA